MRGEHRLRGGDRRFRRIRHRSGGVAQPRQCAEDVTDERREIPDVNRVDWTDYVGEGFNISASNTLLLNGFIVAGYLLPWGILAYYLMKSREVAS